MVLVVALLCSSGVLAVGALVVMLHLESFLLRRLLLLLGAWHLDILGHHGSVELWLLDLSLRLLH